MASPIKLSPMVAPFLVEAPGIKELERIKKDVAKIGKKIGDSIGNTGRKMTMGLTLPILGAAGASVKLSTDANRSLASIGTLIPGQRDKLEGYRKEIDSLAVSSATSFETLSDGLYQSISALGDNAQAMTALKVANKAAKAGVADTKDSITLLSGVAKGYNNVTDEMISKTSDLAFTTVKLGVTTFPELAANMGKVTPIASVLGVSVEELFGTMATLTGVTGETSEVSTQLASIMGRLLKGGDGLDQVFQKLGAKSGKDLIDKTGGLHEALMAMKDAVGGSDAAFSKLLGRKEAILAGLTLTGIQAENATIKINAMKNSVGATDAAYREQTDGVNKGEFQFKQFLETLKSLGRAIGDKLIPILSRWGAKLKPIVEKITMMDDATLEMYMKIAGAVAVVGPALMVFGKLFTVISSVVGAVSGAGGLTAVLATLAGPAGAAAVAIVAAGAGIAYFWEELKPVRDAISGELIGLFDDLSAGTGDMKTDFGDLGDTMKEFVKFAAPVWAVMGKIWIKVHTSPLMLIVRQFKKVIGVAKGLIKIFHSIKTIFSSVFRLVGNMMSTLGRWSWGTFKKIFTEISEATGLVDTDLFKTLSKAFNTMSWAIPRFFEKLGEAWAKFKKMNIAAEISEFFAEKMGALSGGLARISMEDGVKKGPVPKFNSTPKIPEFSAEGKIDFSSQNKDKLEVDININANGAKAGVVTRGKKTRIRNGQGGPIMATDGGI